MRTTDRLNEILKSSRPEDISEYLESQKDIIIDESSAFSDYIRAKIRSRGLTQQEVFLQADISEKYGYKLISGEKHTKQRDYIIRLCTATHLSLDETQKALQLYGMAPLYSRIPRDAVIIVAINNNLFDVNKINDLLESNGFALLHQCRGLD